MSESTTVAVEAPAAGKGGKLKAIGLALLALGAILCAVAYLDEDSRKRFGYAYMLGFVFAWSIVVGSLFFIALQHVTRSVWSVVLRRTAEMLASPLAMFLLVALFLPLLALALLNPDYTIFKWMIEGGMGNDHLQHEKAPYLNQSFFLIRTVFYFAIWMFFAWFFVRGSLKQDSGSGDVKPTLRMRAASGPFLILFGFTVTFAAFDWMMSLEPSWFSTIYGVYAFSGITLAGLAAITIAVVGLRAKGLIAPELVRPDHLYSLGGLLFAFTCFWGYISFSQFMLIWYANIPEETIYYVHRTENGWLAITWAVAILRFILPFFLLLGRGAKMDGKRLVQVSVLILVGQVVDLYWLIMPSLAPESGPMLGWQELAPLVMFSGVILLTAGLFLGRHKTVAAGDPLFEKSKAFHL
ncbi:MAG: quinol:cytochrome C oxidoreductase [Planctomycetota bacterium]|nr:quinol:cytochrome C oxidoreductase [Planctomycetota bacterium]